MLGNQEKDKGRGGGRPVGSKNLRQFFDRISQDQAAVVVSQSQPGSIEFARQCLAAKRAANQMQVRHPPGRPPLALTTAARTELAKHGSLSDMFLVGSDLQQDLVQSVASAYKHYTSEDMKDTLLDHLETTPMTTMSFKAVEEKTGQSNVGQKIVAIAAAMLEFSYMLWGLFLSLFHRLCSGTATSVALCKPVLFLLKLRYDETPTKVRVLDPGLTTLEKGVGGGNI